MVDVLNATGAAERGLAMPGFMENALMQLDAIRESQMFGPIDPDRKLPHTATRDMAAAAARLLTDPSWSGQKDQPVLGLEDLSFTEIAAIISEVTECEVRYLQVPFDAFNAQLLGSGMPNHFAEAYVAMMRAKNDGMDNASARTPGTTGPTSFRMWAEEVLKPALAR